MGKEEKGLEVIRREKWEQQLSKLAPRFAEILPARVGNARQFVGMVKVAVLRNPSLLAPDVDRMSLVMSVLALAEMGLSPGPLAHLLPFRQGNKKVVVPVPDYKGLVDVACATGKISSFKVAAVYKNDAFSYTEGTEEKLIHVRNLEGDGDSSRGAFVGAYSIAFPSDGGRPWVTFMPRHDIEVIRGKSKGYQYALQNGTDSPWLVNKKPGEFRPGSADAEMAIKTAVRRQFKILPKSPEMMLASSASDDAEDMTPPVPDESVQQILELEPLERPDEPSKDERIAIVKKLMAVQQGEAALFAKAAVSLRMEPKLKLESLSFDGLIALSEAIEEGRNEDRQP